MPLSKIAIGAAAAAQASEVDGYAGNSSLTVRILPDARVILGYGQVGLKEIVDGADLTAAMNQASQLRSALSAMAASQPTTLYPFTRI